MRDKLEEFILDLDVVLYEKQVHFKQPDEDVWYSRESCKYITLDEVLQEILDEIRLLDQNDGGRMKVKSIYVCDVCGKEFKNEADAAACEKNHEEYKMKVEQRRAREEDLNRYAQEAKEAQRRYNEAQAQYEKDYGPKYVLGLDILDDLLKLWE